MKARKENSTLDLLLLLAVMIGLGAWHFQQGGEQRFFRFIPHLPEIALGVGLAYVLIPLFVRRLRAFFYVPLGWLVWMTALAVGTTFLIQWLVDHGVRK